MKLRRQSSHTSGLRGRILQQILSCGSYTKPMGTWAFGSCVIPYCFDPEPPSIYINTCRIVWAYKPNCDSWQQGGAIIIIHQCLHFKNLMGWNLNSFHWILEYFKDILMFWKPLFHTLTRLSIWLTWDLCNIHGRSYQNNFDYPLCLASLSEYIFSGCGPWWLFALYVGNPVSKPHKTWNTWTLGQSEEAHQISSIFKAHGCYSLRKFYQGNWKLQPKFMFFLFCSFKVVFFLFQSVWTPLIATYTVFGFPCMVYFSKKHCTVLHENSRSSVIFQALGSSQKSYHFAQELH